MEQKNNVFVFSFNPDACNYCTGKCCCGEIGYIWLNKNEIEAISDFLNIEKKVFIADYLRKENGKYTIKDIKFGGYYSCLFFDRDKKQCTIYHIRPKQCRTYPFWDIYEDNPEPLLTECLGVEMLSHKYSKNSN